jgi:HEAT repeat protein
VAPSRSAGPATPPRGWRSSAFTSPRSLPWTRSCATSQTSTCPANTSRRPAWRSPRTPTGAPLRSDLRELLPHLTGTVPADKLFGSPLGGAAVILAAAVGALDDQTLTSGLAALLTGSRQERLAAATLISRLGRHELTAALVTLVNDPYPDVRAEAARALATRVASSDTGIDPLAIAGLQRALANPGALVSLAIAAVVDAAEAPSDQACELITPLLDHPSALVREAAAGALQG